MRFVARCHAIDCGSPGRTLGVRTVGRGLKAMTVPALATVAALVPAAEAVANVIYNPSFEHGLRGWQTGVVRRGSSPGFPRISVLRRSPDTVLRCEKPHRHSPYIQMEVPSGSAAYIEQSIILPVNPGRLTFRTWGDLEPVTVTLSIVDGPVVRRTLSFTPPGLRASPGSCSHRQPVTESVNMARYAGQLLGIRIQATARGAQGAIADFDAFQLAER